jgi:hypothetical protein
MGGALGDRPSRLTSLAPEGCCAPGCRGCQRASGNQCRSMCQCILYFIYLPPLVQKSRMLSLLCCPEQTQSALCQTSASKRDAIPYGRSLRASLQCSSWVACQHWRKRWASPHRCRAPRVHKGRPHRCLCAHLDTHGDLLHTPSNGATPTRAGRQRDDFRRGSALAG